MFRSLQIKLVLIFFILITSVMTVLGAFLLNSVTLYYFEEFNTQISSVFSTEVISSLTETSKSGEVSELKQIIDAYEGPLGIDNNRAYYLINASTLETVVSSSTQNNIDITHNILKALNGEVGFDNSLSDAYMDFAIPIDDYILYISDDKHELSELTWTLFGVTLQAMFLGLIVSIFLSIFLSKTMTIPIENLTKSAIKRAKGDFSEELVIQSHDEIGILTDTFNQMSTMLKTTIDNVEKEKNKLSTLFLHMTDGVLAFTRDGNIINMNLRAEDMLGVSFDPDLLFQNIFTDLVMPEYNDTDDLEYIETSFDHKNKTYRILFAPFGDFHEEDSGIIVVVYDITESKKLDDARREFVANVSHELRTPLTNIKSYTETILENQGYLDTETESKFLNIISGETDRMTRIVKDLLTLSKLDHGKIDVNFTTISIKNVIEKVYNAMILASNNANIELLLDINQNLGDIYGDKDRIEQVLTNLVSNAIKYNQSPGKVIISAKNYDKKIEISVSDDGFGIPKEDLARIFERFYRVDKARSREKGGTGLGLAIAKNIIELHRGKISIKSVVEQGTIVTIILPIVEVFENE